MNKKLTINLISHTRNYFDTFYYFLDKVKPENKKLIKVNILSSGMIPRNLEKEPKDIELNYKNFGACYMPKIKYAIEQETPYSVKIDEDIFTTNHIWDYMIENLELLENEDNLFLSSLLSTGIPTVDIYNEQFYNEEDRNKIANK